MNSAATGTARPASPPRQAPLVEAGHVLHITRAASVQFVKPLFFRVIRPLDWDTYHGWLWLDGYELNRHGEAIDRRTIYVQRSGLRWMRTAPTAQPPTTPRPSRTKRA